MAFVSEGRGQPAVVDGHSTGMGLTVGPGSCFWQRMVASGSDGAADLVDGRRRRASDHV